MAYLCPNGHETEYTAFSGGKEWNCPTCKEAGEYRAGEAPRRLELLRSGRVEELRAELRAWLDGS